jgi:hypothetical protein
MVFIYIFFFLIPRGGFFYSGGILDGKRCQGFLTVLGFDVHDDVSMIELFAFKNGNDIDGPERE